MPFIRNSKKREILADYQKKSGIVLQDVPQLARKRNRLYLCLVNGLLLFALLEGTVGCFVSAFEIPVNMVLLTGFTLLLSMLYSMMYYHWATKVVGYLIALAGFSFGIIRYRFVVRSGFASIINIFMAYIEDALDLPIQREYTEYYERGEYSITLCFIFIVLACGLIFNIIISEVKGSLFLLLTTFPVVQLGLYFDENIDVVYFCLYAIAIVMVSLFRGTSHYKLETKKRKGYLERISRSGRNYNYVTDGRTCIKMMCSFGVLILAVTILISVAVPQSGFSMSTKYDDLKDDTEEFARKVALVGFYGMLFDGGSSGGVSRGRMGDSKYVRYDFQTDLILLVPEIENMGDLYLKGYVGSIYEDNQWKTFAQAGRNVEGEAYDGGEFTYCSLMDFPEKLPVWWRMSMVNVGANVNYIYHGYYTFDEDKLYTNISEEDDPKGRFEINQWLNTENVYWNARTTYMQVKEAADSFWEQYGEYMSYEKRMEEKNRQFVYEHYLEVPQENAQVIDRIITEAGLDQKEDVVEGVREYLEENYEYTLIPGKTPRNKDFVNYFLTENPKGYCMYFASSAVLMLRELGIPARFVGGYYVSSSDVLGGEIIPDQDIKEWNTQAAYGTGEIDPDSTINIHEVEVADNSAHAWVEVYVDGFGWIPVDMTPSSEEDGMEEIVREENQGTLAKFITALFSPETAQNVRKTSEMLAIAAGIGLSAFILLYVFAGTVFLHYKKRKYEHGQHPRNLIFQMTADLFRIFKFCGQKRNDKESFQEYGTNLVEKKILKEEEAEQIFAIYERAKYAPGDLPAEECEKFRNLLYQVRGCIYTSLRWYQKLIFRYVFLL